MSNLPPNFEEPRTVEYPVCKECNRECDVFDDLETGSHFISQCCLAPIYGEGETIPPFIKEPIEA